jgi:hypothetical protein
MRAWVYIYHPSSPPCFVSALRQYPYCLHCVTDLLTDILALATVLELTFNPDEETVSQLHPLTQKMMVKSENMATPCHINLRKICDIRTSCVKSKAELTALFHCFCSLWARSGIFITARVLFKNRRGLKEGGGMSDCEETEILLVVLS